MTVKYNLTKDFIEEVRSASDVARVIGRFVKLRKRGKNHVGLCPFHDEKTPSFNVSSDRQMFYCFGCGAGGDVFEFMMRHENMNFAETVVELAKEANLKIPVRTGQQRRQDEQLESLVEANEAALEWFRANLVSEKGSAAREYLASRGIVEDAIEAFEIGFAPDSKTALQKHLGSRFSSRTLEDAGLISESAGETIDRFRRRIILPIRSAGGRLIAFGGRILGQGEPKFLNSPETELFHKSRSLYGLRNGTRAIRRRNFAILVEGYFDAIVLHTAGFENAVAPLGTSLTEEQAKLLRRYADKTIICMDADQAGRNAAVRAAGLLLEQGFAVNIVPLPEGEDPDSFVRQQGKDAFKLLLKSSRPAYVHILDATVAKHETNRPVGKREALEELLPLLERIGDPIESSYAVSETSRALGIEEHIVASELGRRRRGPNYSSSKPEVSDLAWLPLFERKLLIAAIRDPKDARAAVEEMAITKELGPFTCTLLEEIFRNDTAGSPVSIPALKELGGNAEERKAVAAIALECDRESPESAWECAVAIAITSLQRQMRELGDRLSTLESTSAEEANALHVEKVVLKKKIISLEKYRRSDAQH
ncbi:MAG TPA: DNA primase [Acidobacteriota bacterium]|nr:DNA primase [Acidobacteriota bacterium]